MHERPVIATACLSFIKTSDALSHEGTLEKLIQTDLAVAGVTWAGDEWRSRECNNNPLSVARSSFLSKRTLLCVQLFPHFVRQECLP